MGLGDRGMSQKTYPNDMAFPAAYGDIDGGNVYQGMSKREYFSIMILQGLLANRQYTHEVTITAINIANKLIEDLNK